MRTLVLVAVLCASTTAAEANPLGRNPDVRRYEKLDDQCRDHATDVSAPVCRAREALGRKLNRRGICYGERDQAEYQYTWHRCNARSLRGA